MQQAEMTESQILYNTDCLPWKILPKICVQFVDQKSVVSGLVVAKYSEY
jgi:hypothetical protein